MDGKECKNTYSDFPKTSTVQWADDKKTLTTKAKIEFARDGTNFEIVTTENWTLKSKKVLFVDYTATTPRGERKGKYVYDKSK